MCFRSTARLRGLFIAFIVAVALALATADTLCAQCDPTIDCNGNGILDSCDIAESASDDCNQNGIPDECDIAAGTSIDCQLDGIPDECQPTATLPLPTPASAVAFGSSLATDGTRLVVGDPHATQVTLDLGLVRVYRRVGTQWVLESTLSPADPFTQNLNFGTSVAIDGDRIAVGAPGAGTFLTPRRGAVYIFERIGAVWVQTQKLTGANVANFGELGFSVDLSGDHLAAGAWRDLGTTTACGTVRVFTFDGSLFSEQAELIPNPEVNAARFGAALAIDGSELAVGASNDTAGGVANAGAVHSYTFGPTGIAFLEKISATIPTALDEFGAAVAIARDTLLVGAPGNGTTGRVDLFGALSSGTATARASLFAIAGAPGDAFGTNVAWLQSETAALQAVIAAPLAPPGGKVSHFVEATGGWNEVTTLATTQTGEGFGAALAGADGFAVVGSPAASLVSIAAIGLGPDCDGDTLDDRCAISDGLVPDCDANLVPDACDIAAGVVADCDLDGVPDNCQLAAGSAADCNLNGILDSCDISSGVSGDCDLDGVPDECESDCDLDGTPDSCAVLAGSVPDCNLNLVPDSCDIASGLALDCDGDGIPDDCAIAGGLVIDCDGNGVPDSCDLVAATHFDCDGNGTLDICDIAAGALDCDLNGIPDDCDVAAGGTPDTDPPTWSGVPTDVILFTDPGACTASGTWIEPVATDTCQLASVTSTHQPGDTFPEGLTIVTYTATDLRGNSAAVQLFVNVIDDQAPTVTNLPADFLLTADAGTCTAVATWGPIGATDNCPGASASTDIASGSLFPLGVTTVTATAIDLFGNLGTATFTVTVVDSEAPTIIGLPTSIVTSNDPGLCGAVVDFMLPTATDSCPGATISLDAMSGDLFPVGITTVTATAIDAGGLTTVESFTITVEDIEAPTLPATLAPRALSLDSGVCTASAGFDLPLATDPCGTPEVVADIALGTPLPIGTTVVTFTATDATGNLSQVTQELIVSDDEDPQLGGLPASITVPSELGACGASVGWTPLTVSDNCPGATLSLDVPNGGFFPVGTTLVTVTATDAAGRTATASFPVTVEDSEAPSLIGVPTDISLPSDPGACGAVVTWSAPSAIDPCAGATVTVDTPSGSFFPAGATVVTATATDAAGNETVATFTVTVLDTTAPLIAGVPAAIQVAPDPGSCVATVGIAIPTATDPCGIASFTNDLTGVADASAVYPQGSTVVTWTATDLQGNATTASVTVTVEVPLDDCDGNGVPDVCDLLEGTATDCNGNGIPDSCDLAGGFSLDTDANGVPDECEAMHLRGDTNNDGAIDITDAVQILGALFEPGWVIPCLDAHDTNDDDTLTIADAVYLLDYNFTGGPPMPAPFPTCGVIPGISLGCAQSGCP